jgi:alpha-beta hydrolase superfamily lysophospholipase
VSKPSSKPTWLSDMLAGLAMASGVGYVAAAYSVSRWLTRATPGKPRRTPADLGLCWDLLECRTADGFRLKGWVVTPAQPRATVLLCHGVRQNREQTLSRTAFLTAAGYRCVAFDHRAHGQSDGRRTSFGYYESGDVIAFLALVRRRWPRQPLAALGMSMGAAALCFAAPLTRVPETGSPEKGSDPLNSRALTPFPDRTPKIKSPVPVSGTRVRGAEVAACDALILESLYHDIHSAFANRVGASYPAWFRRLSRGVQWITERRLGLRMEKLAPAEHIGNLAPAPVLLLTGTEDSHAPPRDAQRLYDRCRGPRELWLVPEASHLDLFQAGGLAYQQRVLSFLDRWLPRAA